ncbi:MAG: hypothetical protein ACK4PR_07190 [Gammaproteobacteria bacterium]
MSNNTLGFALATMAASLLISAPSIAAVDNTTATCTTNCADTNSCKGANVCKAEANSCQGFIANNNEK